MRCPFFRSTATVAVDGILTPVGVVATRRRDDVVGNLLPSSRHPCAAWLRHDGRDLRQISGHAVTMRISIWTLCGHRSAARWRGSRNTDQAKRRNVAWVRPHARLLVGNRSATKKSAVAGGQPKRNKKSAAITQHVHARTEVGSPVAGLGCWVANRQAIPLPSEKLGVGSTYFCSKNIELVGWVKPSSRARSAAKARDPTATSTDAASSNVGSREVLDPTYWSWLFNDAPLRKKTLSSRANLPRDPGPRLRR